MYNVPEERAGCQRRLQYECRVLTMLACKRSTKNVIISGRPSRYIKRVHTGTIGRGLFSKIEIVKIQSKLANLIIHRSHVKIARSTSFRRWILGILDVSAIICDRCATRFDQKRTAHAESRSAVAVDGTAFTGTFRGRVTGTVNVS